MGGNAGAGGVMLALGADRVLARAGVVLNPHYRTMGLYGSEYWTYVLPRRVGAHRAESLTGRCEPVDAWEAVRIGLVDEVLAGPQAFFEEAVLRYATKARGPHRLLPATAAQARCPGRRRAPPPAGGLPLGGARPDEPGHLRRSAGLRRGPTRIRQQADQIPQP